MLLKIKEYPVKSVAWGKEDLYEDGNLTICKKDLLSYLEDCRGLEDFGIKEISLVSPFTASRVVNVYDVMPCYLRLGEGAVNYPGFLGNLQPLGSGSAAAIPNLTVLSVSSRSSRYNKVMDKSGPGAGVSLYAEHFHLVVETTEKNPDMPSVDYFNGIKRIGLYAGIYLAGIAGKSQSFLLKEYSLGSDTPGLPRVAYVCMLASLQTWDSAEKILYGDNLSDFLPTILHPNEFFEGAIIAPNFNLGIDTYTLMNHPVIKGLYERHGREINFAGVVTCVAHVTYSKRERSVQMTVNLVKNILKADLAILTKVGGGIPESDVMLTVEGLENLGVGTCLILWSHLGDGTIKDLLTAYSVKADAMVNVGINDEWITLCEQENVLGGNIVGPFSDDPKDKPQPAGSEIRVRYRDICGAINQFGASKVCLKEIGYEGR